MTIGDDTPALTWVDTDGEIYSWPSRQAWVTEWWIAQHAEHAQVDAKEAGLPVAEAPDSPALNMLLALAMRNDAAAIPLIVALADAAETEDDVLYLGAAEIEDLLVIGGQGDRFIGEVEIAARSSPAFAQALTGMWVSHVAPALKDRLLALGAIDHERPNGAAPDGRHN